MDSLFWRYKVQEQSEMKNKEASLFMKSLKEYQEGYKKIVNMKRFFMSNGKYRNVLQTYAKELDAIFNLAERNTR